MSRSPAFREVADRVWVARHDWFDVNVVLVAGDAGLLVVDTNASEVAARRTLEEVRRVSSAPIVAVVNTHEHFDHTLGNALFTGPEGSPDARLIAHEEAAANTVASGEAFRERLRAAPDDPHRDEVLATTPLPASETFSSAMALDLGDRAVELVHPGRGHTSGDLVVRIPDADVLLAGDLVEESGPPGFGDDCHPLDWPLTLDLVSSLLTPDSVVVPGHGAPVDLDFVMEQRAMIGSVAQIVLDLAGRGVPADRALETADWPWPVEHLVDGVRRAYAQLPPGALRLPMA